MSGRPRTGAYEAVTRAVRVSVTPRYSAEQSSPESGRWLWTYQVRITNEGDEAVRLIARHWIITDGANRTEEVRGPGVVGEQPTIAPGETYEYASACPLATPSGIMRGAYQMVTAGGEVFDAEIPAFSLDLPQTVRTLN